MELKYCSVICLLIVPVFCTLQWQCPPKCSCDKDDYNVMCIGQGLTSIPAGIPTNTKLLQLPNNSIASLNALVYFPLPELETLNLDNNNIDDLEALKSINSPGLLMLQLQNNLLTTFSLDVLERFKELFFINLKNNSINTLILDGGSNTFQEIDLQDNNISKLVVSPNADILLKHKTFYLEGNPIDCCTSKTALIEYREVFVGTCSSPANVNGLPFQEALTKIGCYDGSITTSNTKNNTDESRTSKKKIRKSNAAISSHSSLLWLFICSVASASLAFFTSM